MSQLMNIDWRKEPHAPPVGTVLCDLQLLESGSVREFSFAGDTDSDKPFRLIVYRQGETVHAYLNQCPHHWLPMNRGDGKFLMWSGQELMCSHHSAVFNLLDAGVCLMGPCQGSNLIQVPLTVTDGQVRIAAGV